MGGYTQTVMDDAGEPIEVGSRVHYFDEKPEGWNVGEVIEITEWEGDVDDEGRSIGIPPVVRVRFLDGEGSHVEAYATNQWEHEYGRFDDEGVVPASCHSTGVCEELNVLRDEFAPAPRVKRP